MHDAARASDGGRCLADKKLTLALLPGDEAEAVAGYDEVISLSELTLQRCAALIPYTPSTGAIGLASLLSFVVVVHCLHFASLVQRDRTSESFVLAIDPLGTPTAIISRGTSPRLSKRSRPLPRSPRTHRRTSCRDRAPLLEREVLRRAARFKLYEVLTEPVQAAVGFGHSGVAGDEEDGTGGVHPGLVLQLRDLRDCGAEKLVENLRSPVVIAHFVVDPPCWGGH